MKQMHVQIVDRRHPHYGCRGYVEVNDDDTVTTMRSFGPTMVRVELTHCPHRTDACFVRTGSPGDVTLTKASADHA